VDKDFKDVDPIIPCDLKLQRPLVLSMTTPNPHRKSEFATETGDGGNPEMKHFKA
jgi:hypothetical protein